MKPETVQRVLLIIPTYNERENLSRLIDRIPAEPAADLLFVDDRSTDGTAEWIRGLQARRPGTHLIERPHKMGLGTAYTAGFAWALERGYDFIFEMDADLSHDPAEIPNLIRRANDGADLVVGSRYVDGIRVINWPLRRLFLSRFASFYTWFWTGLPLTDPTSGFKCFRREALAALDLQRIRSNGYAFQIEVSYYLWRKGFRLAEVPIVFTDRHQGVSKMNPRIVREAALLVPWLRFTYRG